MAAPPASDVRRPLQPCQRARKRVVVFTVSAGGGHLAAAEAVSKALGEHHTVTIVTPVEGGAREYNHMMAWGWRGPLNFLGALQDVAEQTIIPFTTGPAMGAALDAHRPDLLISVLPFANGVAWRAAKDRGLPMLVIPTDLGIDHYVKSIQDVDANLKVALPFDLQEMRTRAGPQFAAHNFVPLGYPVRPEFSEQEAAGEASSPILDRLGIASGDKVVLMMMGAGGGAAATMIEDAQALLAGLQGRDDQVHLVCLCGKNAALLDALTQVVRRQESSALQLHALGFVDATVVATLMRRGSVIITKTGGGTVNEALAARLPLLLRAGDDPLWWESGNADFVTQAGLGEWTRGGAQLVGQVASALQRKRPTLDVCPARHFGRNLLEFIDVAFAPTVPQAARVRRPRVMILSSHAGAGHAAAAGAIQTALRSTCDTVVETPYDLHVGLPLLVPLQGVDVYNAVQAHGPLAALDLLGGLQRLVAPLGDLAHGPALDALMAQHQPDLVVSVVPMGHGTAYKAARAHNIPMVVVPTDLEFDHFVDQIPSEATQFKLALPYSQLRTQAPHLQESAFAVTGYPVRGEFLEALGAPAASGAPGPLLRRLGIEASDQVVMIMMGGGGVASDRVVRHAERLVQSLGASLPAGQRAHVVCVCGRNEQLARNLAPLLAQNRSREVRAHALGQCDAADIATLMARAGVLITKPGGATVNEALAAQVPQLYDVGIGAPLWERANADFAIAQGAGAWVEPDAMVGEVAKILLRGRPRLASVAPSATFPERLQALVMHLLQPPEEP